MPVCSSVGQESNSVFSLHFFTFGHWCTSPFSVLLLRDCEQIYADQITFLANVVFKKFCHGPSTKLFFCFLGAQFSSCCFLFLWCSLFLVSLVLIVSCFFGAHCFFRWASQRIYLIFFCHSSYSFKNWIFSAFGIRNFSFLPWLMQVVQLVDFSSWSFGHLGRRVSSLFFSILIKPYHKIEELISCGLNSTDNIFVSPTHNNHQFSIMWWNIIV